MANKKSKSTPEKKVTGEEKGTKNVETQVKKEECNPQTSIVERKVLSLCVDGAWQSVCNILRDYRWKDKTCFYIVNAIKYCVANRIPLNHNNVQLALIRIHPSSNINVGYVTCQLLDSKLLVSYAKKLLNM